MNPIKHVAIIMDGNGRWGIKNKKSRNQGHRAGLSTVVNIIKHTVKKKIKYLTLYAFSTENWKRPKKEVNFLFNLLEEFLTKKINLLELGCGTGSNINAFLHYKMNVTGIDISGKSIEICRKKFPKNKNVKFLKLLSKLFLIVTLFLLLVGELRLE